MTWRIYQFCTKENRRIKCKEPMEQLRTLAAKEYLEKTRNGEQSKVVLARLAKKHQVSARTILRWVKKKRVTNCQ